MMNKYTIFIFLLLISISIAGFSQDLECGTIASYEDYEFIRNTLNSDLSNLKSTSSEMMYFNLQHHIIRTTSKTGGLDPNVIPQIMSFLNSVYYDANIQFVSCAEPNYIDDDNYYTFHYANESILTSLYNVDNAINIYYPNYIERNGKQWWGYSHFPSDNINCTMVAIENAPNLTTAAHELGHFFNLIHTFSTVGGVELVTRDTANCNNRGDLLCDTPADYKITPTDVSLTCEYIGSRVDSKGQAYVPSVENIMSYSKHECRNEFTPQQNIILNAAANLPVRQAFLCDNTTKSGSITKNMQDEIIKINNAIIPSSSNVKIHACDYVLLEYNITIENGAEILIR